MSEKTNVVSPRPCGKPAGPPKFKAFPLTFTCGSPMGRLMPSLMPKSVGFSSVFGVNVMCMRLKPKRASFVSAALKVCVSLKVKICRCDWRVSPKPGMVLP